MLLFQTNEQSVNSIPAGVIRIVVYLYKLALFFAGVA